MRAMGRTEKQTSLLACVGTREQLDDDAYSLSVLRGASVRLRTSRCSTAFEPHSRMYRVRLEFATPKNCGSELGFLDLHKFIVSYPCFLQLEYSKGKMIGVSSRLTGLGDSRNGSAVFGNDIAKLGGKRS